MIILKIEEIDLKNLNEMFFRKGLISEGICFKGLLKRGMFSESLLKR